MTEESKEKKPREKKHRIKTFFKEFREFISRGNVLDLAVGVIIGAAFGKIVTSLTNDMIMPLVTLAMGKNSLSELSVELRPAVLNEAGETVAQALTWNWGNFLQTIIDFLIIAFVVFLIIKVMMHVKRVGEKISEEGREFVEKVKDVFDGDEESGATGESAETEPLKKDEREK